MISFPLIWYLIAIPLWVWCINREGGIGIGFRYLYMWTVLHQFLVGPPLYFLSGLAQAQAEYADRSEAIQLVLYAMIGFTIGGYILPPLILGRALSANDDWQAFSSPLRLHQQWQAAKRLVAIGFISLLLVPIFYRIPTVRAIWSQVTLLGETGLIMMCSNGILSHNRQRILTAFALLGLLGLVKALTSGFFGGTMMTALFMLSLILMTRRISMRSWVYLLLATYLALIPYSIWLSGRQMLREAIERGETFKQRIDAFLDTASLPGMFKFWDPENVKAIQHRIDQSHLLASAMRHTPAVEPYAGGSTIYKTIAVAAVPRILWPSKPLVVGSNEYVARFTGLAFQGVSVGTNYVFEFYVNFGPLGAVAGVGVLGIVCGLLDYHFFRRGARSLPTEWTMILCLWTICTTDRVSQLVMTLPVAIFVGWGLRKWFQTTAFGPIYFPERPSLRVPDRSAAAVRPL